MNAPHSSIVDGEPAGFGFFGNAERDDHRRVTFRLCRRQESQSCREGFEPEPPSGDIGLDDRTLCRAGSPPQPQSLAKLRLVVVGLISDGFGPALLTPFAINFGEPAPIVGQDVTLGATMDAAEGDCVGIDP